MFEMVHKVRKPVNRPTARRTFKRGIAGAMGAFAAAMIASSGPSFAAGQPCEKRSTHAPTNGVAKTKSPPSSMQRVAPNSMTTTVAEGSFANAGPKPL